MVIMSSDVTNEIKHMVEQLVERGIYKSQSEVVRDAIRQLAYKYGIKISGLDEVRRITARATKKSGETLSQATKRIRNQDLYVINAKRKR